MNLLNFALRELLSYNMLSWCAFIAVAFLAARFGGLLGMFAGHFVIAGLVAALDVHWVTTAMRAPDWPGTPEFDFVFMIGVIVRVILINTVLFVVTIPALRRWARTRDIDTGPNLADLHHKKI
jgi:type VI protein secretion system component VasK